MEKDIMLGQVGKVALVFAAGKATLSVSAAESVEGGAASVQASVSALIDAGALIDLLFAAIEKASPVGVQPIEAGVQAIVKSAVLAIA